MRDLYWSPSRLRTTTEEHADDLHRLIMALDTGPVDIFASSGGAVNGLALVAGHPEQVRTLVAHEPPTVQVLPDREEALATCLAIRETYHRAGYGAAMAKFIALASQDGPLPAGFASQPGPDPASFGLPAGDDGSRDDPLVGLNMPSTPGYYPEYDALRAAPVRGRRGAVGHDARRPRGYRRGRAARDGTSHLPWRPRRIR
jgi:pimeloyl-ACP methyl ester carboxylesterase